MKSGYTKPMIVFESFELSHSIAKFCNKDTVGYAPGTTMKWTNAGDVDTCGFYNPTFGMYTWNNSNCQMTVTEDLPIICLNGTEHGDPTVLFGS